MSRRRSSTPDSSVCGGGTPLDVPPPQVGAWQFTEFISPTSAAI